MNVVLLLAVTHGWFNHGPQSFRAQFERDISSGLARSLEAAVVTEVDLIYTHVVDAPQRAAIEQLEHVVPNCSHVAANGRSG